MFAGLGYEVVERELWIEEDGRLEEAGLVLVRDGGGERFWDCT